MYEPAATVIDATPLPIDVDEPHRATLPARLETPAVPATAGDGGAGLDPAVVQLAQALTAALPAVRRHADAAVLLGEVAECAAASRRGERTQVEYAQIYTRFVGWLAAELGHAPTVADLDERSLLAYRDHRRRHGGRSGAGVASATLRKELAALRVLAQRAGRPDLALDLALPIHQPPPAATITEAEYERALRMPDRRTRTGRRDHAILAVLGETGIRNAELRALTGADLIRRRRDSPTRSIRVHGKGGHGRTLILPRAADQAVEDWLARHPLALRAGTSWVLPAEAPLFVILGRHERDLRTRPTVTAGPLSTSALEDLVAKHLLAAGVDRALAHPHVLRSYHLTRLKALGARDDAIRERSGHRDPRVLHAHYLALVDHDRDQLVETLDAAATNRADLLR